MSNATKPTHNPKEETVAQPSSGHRKNPSPATRAAEQAPPQKCPRCDSPNTKFCYYNNYSLTQPRHFCKTCRRYWTRGGALRNVPVGGGCRKNKKMKSSSSDDRHVSKDSSSSSNAANNNHFMLFHGISPAMDFNLATATNTTASLFDYHQNPNTNNNSSNNNMNSHNSLLSLASGSNNNNNPSSLASSIESLSSINQDLHWKLQQQRLALLFGNHGVSNSNGVYAAKPTKPYHTAVPILFQNLEISKPLLPNEFSGGERKLGSRDDRMVIGSDNSQTGNMDQWFFGSDQVVQLAQPHHHHHHNDHQGVDVNNNVVHQANIESVTGGANWMNNNVNWNANSTSSDLQQFSASLP